MAWATLGLGIAAWTLLPTLGAFVGAILGWMELQNIKKGQSSPAGKSVTLIGFWLSVANLALSVVAGCLLAAYVVMVVGGISTFLLSLGLAGG